MNMSCKAGLHQAPQAAAVPECLKNKKSTVKAQINCAITVLPYRSTMNDHNLPRLGVQRQPPNDKSF